MARGYPDYRYFSFPVSVNEGGSGVSALTLNGVLIGNATSPLKVSAAGAADEVFRVPAAGGEPAFGPVDLSKAASTTGILPVTKGGTGTATPSLVAGTGISIAGSWPNQTVTNTSPASALGDPVTVAHGGTGTATPSLVAGANITITGTWPNNTIALTSPITGAFIVGDGAGAEAITINGGAGSNRGLRFWSAGSTRWFLFADTTAEGGSNSGSNLAVIRYDDAGSPLGYPLWIRRSDGQVGIGNIAPGKALDVTGDVRASLQLISSVAVGTAPLAVTSTTEVANLRAATATDLAAGSLLAVAKGGTGTATPALVAGNGIQITGTWPANTIANTWGATTVSNAAADGALLIGSGAGTAAWGTPHGARVYNDAAESIAPGATALTFNSERYDNGGLHSTASNTSRLTAQKAGKYSITGHAQFAANATGVRGLWLRLNGATLIAGLYVPSVGAVLSSVLSVETVYHLAGTDYVELLAYQDSGGDLSVQVAANYSPEFAMQWLGP